MIGDRNICFFKKDMIGTNTGTKSDTEPGIGLKRNIEHYINIKTAGKTTGMDIIDNKETKSFTPPSSGYGQDWILVVDDAAKQYPKL